MTRSIRQSIRYPRICIRAHTRGPAWKFTIGANKQSRGHNGSPVSVVLNRRFLVNRGTYLQRQNTLYTFITNDTMQFFFSRRIYFPTSFHHLGAKISLALIYFVDRLSTSTQFTWTYAFVPSPLHIFIPNDIQNKFSPNLKSVIRRRPERAGVYTRKRAIERTGEKSGTGLEAFPSSTTADRDSRDTIFHPRVRTGGWQETRVTEFTSSDFLLRNESLAFTHTSYPSFQPIAAY